MVKHLKEYLGHNAINMSAITITTTSVISIPSWVFESREVLPHLAMIVL